MEPTEPDRPPSLDLSDLGDRWRGQLRPAQDPIQVRKLVWSAGSAVFLLVVGASLSHPVAMGVAYLAGFLLLVVTAYTLFSLVALPLTIELAPTYFEIGEDRFALGDIASADATPGPVKLVLVLKSGERRVWLMSEEHHNLDDIAWLAEQVRDAAGR